MLIFKKEKVSNSNNDSYLSVYGHTNSSQSVSFISTNMPGRLQKSKEIKKRKVNEKYEIQYLSKLQARHVKKTNNWVVYRDFFKVCSPRRALKGNLGRGLQLRLSNPIYDKCPTFMTLIHIVSHTVFF